MSLSEEKRNIDTRNMKKSLKTMIIVGFEPTTFRFGI